MEETDAPFTKSFIQNHRRRRAKPNQPNENLPPPLSVHPGGEKSGSVQYYYDDSAGDDKGHRHNEDRIFQGSCSFGQFVLNPCLCMFNAAYSCIHGWRFRRREKKMARALFFVVGVGTIAIYSLSDAESQFTRRSLGFSTPGRPLTDEMVNQIPVTIPILDFRKDIGGWSHLRRFFHSTLDLNSVGMPDFGDLDVMLKRESDTVKVEDVDESQMLFSSSLHSTQLLAKARTINLDDEKLALAHWEESYESDYYVHTYDRFPEEREDEKRKCRQPNWAKRYYPQCNSIHEIALTRDYDPEAAKSPGYDQPFDNFYISHGYYRDVWVIHQQTPVDVKTVLKITRYKHDYDKRTYWNTLADAMVMERLTASPRIIDIYGHCGTSVWVEAIPNEVEEVIIHGKGMAKQEDLYNDGFKPLNNYTVEEKLDMALSMAESLADLHGFRDGVIVHDDVQLCQWLRTKDGRLKLGDFNRAEVMEFNLKKKEYCRYYNGHCYGNYRAPEEYAKDYLNEAIDVFSFGNNIYGLLTGLWVFYDTDDDPSVQSMVINGTRALIDPRWRERSFIESKLVDVMEQCWKSDIHERMDIFQAVQKLREVKKEYEKRKA